MWGVCEPAYGGIEAKKRYFPNIAQEWQKSVPRISRMRFRFCFPPAFENKMAGEE